MVPPKKVEPTTVLHPDPVAAGNRKLLWAMTVGVEVADAVLADAEQTR